MISESKLRELLHDNVPESSILDFKRDLYRLDKKDGEDLRSKFMKDILSMANTPREEASYIVIGVTANPNGTKTLVGVPRKIILMMQCSNKSSIWRKFNRNQNLAIKP